MKLLSFPKCKSDLSDYEPSSIVGNGWDRHFDRVAASMHRMKDESDTFDEVQHNLFLVCCQCILFTARCEPVEQVSR